MKRYFAYSWLAVVLALGSRMSADEVVSPGPPPLMRSVLDKVVGLVEWELDLRFTAGERREFEQIQIDKWNRSPEGRESLLNLTRIYDQVQGLPPNAKADA